MWFDHLGVHLASINSITFDLADCSLRQQSANHRGWMNSAGVAHMLRFYPGPPDWPFDLNDLNAATEYYWQQCANNGGVMLAMEITTVAGAEALRGLFKYRAPLPGSLAMYYLGILWLPFHDCNFQINIEAMESAGQNRQGVADERAVRERASNPSRP